MQRFDCHCTNVGEYANVAEFHDRAFFRRVDDFTKIMFASGCAYRDKVYACIIVVPCGTWGVDAVGISVFVSGCHIVCNYRFCHCDRQNRGVFFVACRGDAPMARLYSCGRVLCREIFGVLLVVGLGASPSKSSHPIPLTMQCFCLYHTMLSAFACNAVGAAGGVAGVSRHFFVYLQGCACFASLCGWLLRCVFSYYYCKFCPKTYYLTLIVLNGGG